MTSCGSVLQETLRGDLRNKGETEKEEGEGSSRLSWGEEQRSVASFGFPQRTLRAQ